MIKKEKEQADERAYNVNINYGNSFLYDRVIETYPGQAAFPEKAEKIKKPLPKEWS